MEKTHKYISITKPSSDLIRSTTIGLMPTGDSCEHKLFYLQAIRCHTTGIRHSVLKTWTGVVVNVRASSKEGGGSLPVTMQT